ncbi:hypothetical protein L2E82_34079 [Cichorium intybus]|uniref:Uncharacterized protein n=1 Tax=Cichorium intybus TaxID=13427 RepID=A0ACB9BLK5_CICIN|nr:hypothetical protein L2E82_34079 [Cichorium intybus]
MAAISAKRHSVLSRFKTLLPSQCLYHKFSEVGNKPRPRSDKGSVNEPGEINISKWKKMDSRSLGISRTMVPSSPYTLLKILQTKGFEAYLVGGCVRDLLLNRTPKDFDVITTADLNQIKKQFHRCHIVGRRFPICMVHIKGSVIEVSSFKTLAKHSEDKEKFLVSQMPRNCDKTDLKLWKNSMHRDFTVNSLFFDPLIHKIYDYSNGMKDLLELKLRTLVPANLSFTEDCARILRGLRIAARLGLSFSKDIETAIHKHASSLLDLSKSRIMMEMDYMLSYGAAESSLRLLHKYHILDILLPFQASYISRQTSGSDQCNMMLMKMFSHMDKLFSCDQPSVCRLWIGLLAFHQALVNKPQDPFVVLTFASVLYHQEWEAGLQFAKQHGPVPVSFEPEILQPCDFISDDELSEKVNQLALHVLDTIDVLMDTDSQRKRKSTFPGLVFIPKNSAHGAAQLFHVLAHKVDNYNKGRKSFEMDYNLLQKGDVSETRFVLGKIILNTMGCGIDQGDENIHITPSDSTLKKRNIVTEVKKIEDGCVIEQKEAVFEQNVEALQLTCTLETVTGNKTITKEESGNKKYKSKRVSTLSSLFK